MDSHMQSPSPLSDKKRLYDDLEKSNGAKYGREEEEKKQMMRLTEMENQELRDSIRYLELELAKSRENNAALIKKYDKAQDEISNSHTQIARQGNLNNAQRMDNADLKRQLDQFTMAQNEIVEKSRYKVSNFQSEIDMRDDQISKLRTDIIHKDDTIKAISIAQNDMKEKGILFQDDMENKCSENNRLRAKLGETEKNLDELYLSRKSEGTALLELEHLKADNNRLIRLLKSTKEYKDFAEFVEDSGGATHTHSLSPHYPTKKKHSKAGSQEEEAKEWIPHEAFRVAHDFRVKHGNELNETLINKLLSTLNTIWRERERKQITRIKNKYQSEILSLRRQNSSKGTYDEIVAQKQIARLKCDLKNAYKEVNAGIQKQKKDKMMPPGVEAVDQTLKIATAWQRQRKTLEDEKEKLIHKVDQLEKLHHSEDYERGKFMEGATWMGNKLVNECEKLVERMDELINEYNIRTREKDLKGEIDPIFVSRTQAWLLETIDRSTADMRMKFKHMLESSVYHQNLANKNIQYSIGKKTNWPSKKDFLNEIDNTFKMKTNEI